MKKYYLLLLLAFAQNILIAQDSGDQMFDNSALHEIRIEFSESNFFQILRSNFETASQQEIRVPYLMGDVTIDGERVDSIGVRFKGFTSYETGSSNKKPIKIDFNEFVPGKRYDGLRKLNLNNGLGDAAMQRDFIGYELLRNTGGKSPRTAYARVYLNNTYWGLYLLVEQVDKEFLKRNFANPRGNLFKNKGWDKHEWHGSDPSDYSPPYELKTNETANDWSGFINFTNVLNNSSNAEFPTAIQEIFNVDLFLKSLAVDVATNNWDSYLEHGRNWYIYEDTVTGIFHWIPWDYNLSLDGTLFGGGGGGGSTDSIDNPAACQTIIDGSCPYPADDSIFIEVINFDAFCCNQTWDVTCQGFYDTVAGGGDLGGGGGGFSQGFNIDQRPNEGVIIKRLLNVPEFRERYYTYFCDLLHYGYTTDKLFPLMDNNKLLIRDAIEEDPGYLFPFASFLNDIGDGQDNIGLKKYLSNRINTLNTEIGTLTTCPSYNTDLAFGEVAINEFVASNDSLSGISDPNGQYEDWIELYNNTADVVDLSGAFLSDDMTNPEKWPFPSGTTIGANSYLILWADEDGSQAGLHTNFKLAKGGEQLLLSNTDGSVIDSLTFGEQSTNVAAARVPNGTGNFVFQDATFNFNNDTPAGIADLEKDWSVRIFPVPASSELNIEITQAEDEIYQAHIINSIGQIVFQKDNFDTSTNINLTNWSTGFYLLQISDRAGHKSSLKFIVQE